MAASITLQRVSESPLDNVDLSLDAGIHVVLGSPADGTAVLIELCAGLRPPRRGKLLVDGKPPYKHPRIRRRIGSVLAQEPELIGKNVRESIGIALRTSKARHSVDVVLGGSGLTRLAPRLNKTLTPLERRSLTMALALSSDEHAVLCLHEPLSGLPHLSTDWVISRLQELSEKGVCILCTTASSRHGARLQSRAILLEKGRFVRQPMLLDPRELTPGREATLTLFVDDARSLCAKLALDGRVRWLSADTEKGQVEVRGADAASLSLAVLAAAQAQNCALKRVSLAYPEIADIHAASAGLARAAYDAAYRVAQNKHFRPFTPHRGESGT